MSEFEFIVTRNSEKEVHTVEAETDALAWWLLVGKLSGAGVEKIVLVTQRG